MKNRVRKVVVLAVVAAAVYFGNVEVQTWLGERALESSGLRVHSLDEALTRAASEQRLVLAELAAIWCSTCRRLDSDVFGDPRVREAIENDYVFARVEYESDEGMRFRERYGVRGFPVLLVLDHQGKVVRRLPVVFDADRFLVNLRGATFQPRPD